MALQKVLTVVAAAFFLANAEPSKAMATEDWPMWRYGPDRSANSPNQLPENFDLLWKRDYPQRVTAWDDPLNQDLMTYDRNFEPIVMRGKLLLGFSDQDKLVAIDCETGRPLWTFFAEAPIRLAPAGWQDRVFVCSDDGNLYCLDIDTGQLLWQFSGAPNAQHALGNQRLTSAWPARGGPVVRDGVVYFAASIWPFMGTFIYAIDAQTGQRVWVNDSTGSQYLKQPHSAPSFAGVGPQGALVATEDHLIVPGGRSVPAVFSRKDGEFKYFEINAGGKGTGGSFVVADSKQFYVHTRLNGTRAFNISTGKKTAFMPCEPVLCGDHLFASDEIEGKKLISCFQANVESDEKREPLWSMQADASDDLISAGSYLVATGNGLITVINKPELVDGVWKNGEVVKQIRVGERVMRLLVANSQLFAVTEAGSICCFGDSAKTDALHTTGSVADDRSVASSTDESIDDESKRLARRKIRQWLAVGQAEGYALWFGPCQPALLDAWAALSPFVQLAIVDSNADRVAQMRQQLDRLGVYGKITVHLAQPHEFLPPQYVAHMVFVSHPLKTAESQADWLACYQAVRPYGGTLLVINEVGDKNELVERLTQLNLEQAQATTSNWGVIVKREGSLPGSSDWTHQNGDIANTLKSDDKRVRLPLGILWFGGSSNMDVLPRHGHGPPQQVVSGRLYIEGMNSISARDVYTGRVLWQRQFDNLGTFDVYYDNTYEDKPLDPKYNQVHIPGANARGTNYIVTEDCIYLIAGGHCQILDSITGKDIGRISLPKDAAGDQPEWGFIGVYKDILLGGVGFAKYRDRNSLEFETDALLTTSKAGFGSKSMDRAASRALIAFDRHSGKQLWKVDSKHSFWHNGIVAGSDRIYCLDRNPAMVEEAMRRRGINKPDSYRVIALDCQTGQPLWQATESITGTWLGYSEQFDSLLLAGSQASDRLVDEVGKGMRVYNAKDGSVRWSKDKLAYNGPCILHNNWIITNTNSYAHSAGAFDIRTGNQRMTTNPLTGKAQPWKVTRAYGCNSIIASENMLTFRSGAASYCDLLTDSGTGNLGGFKSGCTSNLIVAGGVLNAPDYTRTCSCAYQNQTSLALVHMPGLDTWTVNSTAVNVPENEVIQSLAINVGAPGDRCDDEGRLWLEFPTVGGESPSLAISVNDDVQYFQRHSSSVTETEMPWVYASGAMNIHEFHLLLRTQRKAAAATKSTTEDEDEKKTTANSTSANTTTSTSATATTSAATPNTAATSTAATSGAEPSPPEVELLSDPFPPADYRLELYFGLPVELRESYHEFQVRVSGNSESQTVKLGGDSKTFHQTLVFEAVRLEKELRVEFESKQGATVLNGLKIIRQ